MPRGRAGGRFGGVDTEVEDEIGVDGEVEVEGEGEGGVENEGEGDGGGEGIGAAEGMAVATVVPGFPRGMNATASRIPVAALTTTMAATRIRFVACALATAEATGRSPESAIVGAKLVRHVSSTASISAALANRSSRSTARARATTVSRAGSTSGRSERTRGAGSVRTFTAAAVAVGAT